VAALKCDEVIRVLELDSIGRSGMAVFCTALVDRDRDRVCRTDLDGFGDEASTNLITALW